MKTAVCPRLHLTQSIGLVKIKIIPVTIKKNLSPFHFIHIIYSSYLHNFGFSQITVAKSHQVNTQRVLLKADPKSDQIEQQSSP